VPGALAYGIVAESPDSAERIIHDLHGPLTVIRGLCATLSRDEERPDRRRVIDLIDGEALRLAAGLRGLSSVHPRPPTVTRLDLAALISSAAERYAEIAVGRGRAVATRGLGSAVWIDGHAAALERVIENLLANGLRHCAASGTVELTLSARGGRATLRVRDDGDGVSPCDRERIFRAGDRGSAPLGEGRGLGLAIAREIAEAHGGRLTLDPLGTGACFRLSLPVGPRSHDGPRAA
jgi:signal transduction histidine kinase